MRGKKGGQEWVSTYLAAEMIGCSHTTIFRLCDDGALKYWTLSEGGWRRVWVSSVEKYLKARRNGGGRK